MVNYSGDSALLDDGKRIYWLLTVVVLIGRKKHE